MRVPFAKCSHLSCSYPEGVTHLYLYQLITMHMQMHVHTGITILS